MAINTRQAVAVSNPLGKQFTQGVELVDRQMIGNRVLQHRPAGMFG